MIKEKLKTLEEQLETVRNLIKLTNDAVEKVMETAEDLILKKPSSD